MFRLLLTGVLVYFGYRFIKGFSTASKNESDVQGEQKAKPMDVQGADIEDAKFEDISEK